MTKFKTSEPKVNETQPKDEHEQQQLDVEYGENFEPESLFEENEMEGEEKKKRKNREEEEEGTEYRSADINDDNDDNDDNEDDGDDSSGDEENGDNQAETDGADGEGEGEGEGQGYQQECHGTSPGFDDAHQRDNTEHQIVTEDG